MVEKVFCWYWEMPHLSVVTMVATIEFLWISAQLAFS